MKKSIQIKEDSLKILKSLKTEQNLSSISEAIDYVLASVPEQLKIEHQPPARILEARSWDFSTNYWEKRITWDELKSANKGDDFICEVPKNVTASTEEVATVIYKDFDGVFLLITRYEYPANYENGEKDMVFKECVYYSF